MPFLLLVLALAIGASEFDWQGHRGARGLYPENTINSMIAALNYPIKTLELDVVLSKDHKVVVSHEPWINEEICLDENGKAIHDKKINLYKLTYEEIKKYDCGSLGHPRFPKQLKVSATKPLLNELLLETEKEMSSRDLVKNYSIEIKSSIKQEEEGSQPDYKFFTDKVITEINKILPTNRFMIQSFDWRVLKYLHLKYPQIPLAALREGPYSAEEVIKELGFVPNIFSPEWKYLKASDVKFFHEKKVKVIPWTVNTIEDMKKMIELGVDGIITDYPNLIPKIPTESYKSISECPSGQNRFEGKCVQIPSNAVASDKNPGWVCRPGYHQKRSSCVEIKIPKNAIFTEDGKTWVCKSGYKRYRYRCKKIK